MNRLKKRTITCLIIAASLTALYSFIEPFWINIKTIKLSRDKIPASFKGKKIVFISDIHHGPFLSVNRVKKLVERVNSLSPDIILLGGDYVHGSARYIEPCFKELSYLKAKYGVFGVLGNHDHWESTELTQKSMKNACMVSLDNMAVWVYEGNEKIKIGGVGDLYEDKQDINPTINDVSEDDFVILLSHNPDYAEKIKTSKIDIVLSGHTH